MNALPCPCFRFGKEISNCGMLSLQSHPDQQLLASHRNSLPYSGFEAWHTHKHTHTFPYRSAQRGSTAAQVQPGCLQQPPGVLYLPLILPAQRHQPLHCCLGVIQATLAGRPLSFHPGHTAFQGSVGSWREGKRHAIVKRNSKAETAKLCSDTDCSFPRTFGGPMPWACLEKYRKLLQTVIFCMMPLHKGLTSSPPRSRSPSAASPALPDGSHYVVPCRLRASLRMACNVSSASCIFPSSSWPAAPPPACTSEESSSSSRSCCRYRSTCNHRGSDHRMLGDCLKDSQQLEHQHNSA